jgi:phage shock protein PspC (stress-responsive transcriptional regulator)
MVADADDDHAGAMTQSPPDAPGTEPGPDTGPRVTRDEIRDLSRLRRTTGDRKIAGVAGGIARHLDIDPLLVRVVLAVLAVLSGVGLLIYAACWLIVPQEGTEEAVVRLDPRSRSVALVVVGALAALGLVGETFGGWNGGWGFPWPLMVASIVVLAFLLLRGQHHVHPALRTPPAAPASSPIPPPNPYRVYRPAKPRRRGPLLFFYALAVTALGIGTIGVLDVSGMDVAASVYPAVALGTSAVLLLVGSVWGRPGGLVALGLLAAIATAATTAVDQVDAGRIDRTPQSAEQLDDSYSIGAGEIVIDLRELDDLDALDGRTLDLEAHFGHLEVIVPTDGLDVDVVATIDGGGESNLFGDRTDSDAAASHDGGADAPTLTIEADVVFGQIDVRTARSIR